MNECPECRQGSLSDARVETWMRDRTQRWVLFVGVPAISCDVCDHVSFSQDIAEHLAELLDPERHEVPTAFVYCPVFDLETIERQHASGERPVIVTSGGLPYHIERAEAPLIVVAESIATYDE